MSSLENNERIEQLETENAKLRKALEPFAIFADLWNAGHLDGEIIASIVREPHQRDFKLKIGDFDNARNALLRLAVKC